ncbi:amino acid aminotransferase [Kordiimonas sp. SCSIO 12610]|uniref:amino acid aminotransferase n=1 Tax=Kordiimonas sp. SCSIO 12610 TaxID=2829597 RepID=UPI002108C5F1|nr:amino acid aminotransferase [Kordiimonas sp. SCSIO 12610]UTW54374.1 aspartate/tyrosine/aromatic aminotransferase [Kordiimonas sp. SCSIO 12610]
MLQDLKQLPADPILGLSARYQQDENPEKVDLGVGVYKDDNGKTIIMSAVQKAFDHLAATEGSKVYVSPAGYPGFIEHVSKLIFGESLSDFGHGKIGAVQTPGGCGALRLGFDLIAANSPQSSAWVSNPTWANHVPIIGAAGLEHRVYDYYDHATSSINFAAMCDSLQNAKEGDVVLIHGCCHNPTGADISTDQADKLISIINERSLIPFIDMAYQGFANGLEEDSILVRSIFQACPEAFLTYSCSKNFGLYRERTGAVFVKGNNQDCGSAIVTHLNKIARESYSMPPSHGAAIVTTILESENLQEEWKSELIEMQQRMLHLRSLFDGHLKAIDIGSNVADVANQSGMFSMLNISPQQVELLQKDSSIYMPSNGRVNIAGLTEQKIPYVVNAIKNCL